MSAPSASLKFGEKSVDLPVKPGTDRPLGGRHRQALRPDRHVHLRPGLHLDREHRIEDHLYRRRRGRAALSRLPDRAARRARRFSRDLLSPALRRIADRDAEVGLRLPRHAPHDGPRADVAVLQWLPPRRAPDGGHGGLRRRARGLLSRLRSTSTIRCSARSPRFAWSPRCRRSPRWPTNIRSASRSCIRRTTSTIPRISCACASASLARTTRSIRCWRARSTASSSCTPTTSRTPRPRRCVSPARPAPIRSPASRPASPACGAPRTAAPTKRR